MRMVTITIFGMTAAGCVVPPAPVASGGPAILIDQRDTLVDTPLRIRLHGFPARQPISVTATLHAPDTTWQSQAVFMSDDAGTIDVSTTAPQSGSYQAVSPMGLFWAMQPLSTEPTQPPPGSVMEPRRVTLQAQAPDGTQAEAAVTRRWARPGVSRRAVREAGLLGTLFLPAGGGDRWPAIIVLSGSSGGTNETRAALLSSHGYATLALGYFRMPGLPQGLVNIPLEYFEAAIRWMRSQAWLGDGFLAVMGSSRGGELALLLGATFPEINCVIAVVPSGVVHGPVGQSEPGDTRPPAAWTYRGSPVRYLQQNNRTADPTAVERRGEELVETPLYLALLRDTTAVERSTIPVERVKGPVLMISGKDDAIWPSFLLAQIAQRRLETHRHPYPFAHLAYDGVGHSILVPYGPTTTTTSVLHPVTGLRYALGGSPRGNAEAAADSWPKAVRLGAV